jgi:hypothetical protein
VALGGATPTPIPLAPQSLAFLDAGTGGPDAYLNYPGPALNGPVYLNHDPTLPVFGNENNAITDFTGIYGGAAIDGTGHDNQGALRYWVSDTRFMQGTYLGVDGASHFGTFVEV